MEGKVVQMTREFVMLPEFDRQWKALGLTDKELKSLQEHLTINPDVAPIIKGTGGLRKLRIAFNGFGKSGSARVCYVDFTIYEKIYLITVYSKKEKDNLSKDECNIIKELIKNLENSISEGE